MIHPKPGEWGSIEVLVSRHSRWTEQWKQEGIKLQEEHDFLKLVQENHAFNFQLWHAEDRARREDKGFEWVYHAKREIDSCNQQRNDRMEAMDEWLFAALNPASYEHCPVHSETPGMMIDRLSILTLKRYHMNVQVMRQDVGEEHRLQCSSKLSLLVEQQKQLSECLAVFLERVKTQEQTFRLYRQCKMYNDPSLNPQLYSALANHD